MVSRHEGGFELSYTEARVISNNHTLEFGNLGIRATLRLNLESAPRVVMLSDKTMARIIYQFHEPLHDPDSTVEFTEKEFLTSIIDSSRALLATHDDQQTELDLYNY